MDASSILAEAVTTPSNLNIINFNDSSCADVLRRLTLEDLPIEERKKVADLVFQLTALKSQVETLTTQNKHLEDALEQQRVEMVSERRDAQRKIQILEEKCASIGATGYDLYETNNELKSKLRSVSVQLAESIADRDQWRREFLDENQKVRLLESELNELKDKMEFAALSCTNMGIQTTATTIDCDVQTIDLDEAARGVGDGVDSDREVMEAVVGNNHDDLDVASASFPAPTAITENNVVNNIIQDEDEDDFDNLLNILHQQARDRVKGFIVPTSCC
eukprot:PhM_4_TR13683/c0_g1_i2/m.75383